MTVGRFNKKIAFDLIPELTLDYALGRTTSLSSLTQNAISLAPDFLVDYTLETKYPTVPNESILKRVIFSFLDATYIPFFISIVRKDKPLLVSSSDTIEISPVSKSFRHLLAEPLSGNSGKKNLLSRIDAEVKPAEEKPRKSKK